MSTCKERVSGTWRSFAAGGRTRSRPTAHTLSLRWFRRTNWRRFLPLGNNSGSGFAFRAALLAGLLVQFTPFARRIIVGIGRFLRRPDGFGDVAQVHANARPGGRAAAHRIHQDIVYGKGIRGSRILALPTLETSEG